MNRRALLGLVALVLLACGVQTSSADDDLLCGYRFLRIEPNEQAAVMVDPAGQARLIRAGETLAENEPEARSVNQACDELRIIQFEENLVVLEGEGEWGPRTLFVSIEDGKQSVAFMERRPLLKTQLLSAGERRLQH